MLKAKDLQGNEYLSYKDEIVLDKGYFCPCCNEPVIAKLGFNKIKHFAHYTLSKCEFEPESIDHIEMKMFFMEQLELTKSNLEVNLGWSRPDLLINNKIAIECQCSKISEEEFNERNLNYAKNNIYVLWIFNYKLINQERNEDYITVPNFMQIAHNIYFGRIYIFKPSYITPLRLEYPKGRFYKKFRVRNDGKTITSIKKIICVDNDIYKIARFTDKKWW